MPRVSPAPFFSDQRAWRAARSHAERIEAEAAPEAEAEITLPSASITTDTFTVVL